MLTKLAVSTRGWSLEALLKHNPNFVAVERVSAAQKDLKSTIKSYEDSGKPLVIENFHKLSSWSTELFSLEGFKRELPESKISVRNVYTFQDDEITLDEFIEKSRSISQFCEDGETERLYGKDAVCPASWEDKLQEKGLLPPRLVCNGITDENRYRPPNSSIETMMCYLGVGDTFTPCHKDLCGSSGHNLMVYTENNGSSFWFMTDSASAPDASSYFHELNQELDHEYFVITVEQLSKAPFKVYVIEQKLGDLVLVPPRSAHQVVNYGGITLKTSWSRMTIKGLTVGYYHELPIYRRICRPETYRIKSTIYHALKGHIMELRKDLTNNNLAPSKGQRRNRFEHSLVDAINNTNPPHPEKTAPNPLARDLKKLLTLYDCILYEEYLDPKISITLRSNAESFDDEDHLVCDFCETDIFQFFFECDRSGNDSHNDCKDCIICPSCYVEGRTCQSGQMKPMQCRNFSVLSKTREDAVAILDDYEKSRNQTFVCRLDLEGNPHAVPFARAAYTLHRQTLFKGRKGPRKDTRMCSLGPNLTVKSHCLPYTWTLLCRKCHRSRCYPHILEAYALHSAEALLVHDVDDDHGHFHEFHRDSKAAYLRNQETLFRQRKDGEVPNGFHLLTAISTEYGGGRPFHRDRVSLGWYDTDPLDEMAPKIPRSVVIKGSRRARNNPPPKVLPKAKLFYIEVPPLPYKISRKRPRPDDNLNAPYLALDSSPLTSLPSLPPTPEPSPQKKLRVDSPSPAPSLKPSTSTATILQKLVDPLPIQGSPLHQPEELGTLVTQPTLSNVNSVKSVVSPPKPSLPSRKPKASSRVLPSTPPAPKTKIGPPRKRGPPVKVIAPSHKHASSSSALPPLRQYNKVDMSWRKDNSTAAPKTPAAPPLSAQTPPRLDLTVMREQQKSTLSSMKILKTPKTVHPSRPSVVAEPTSPDPIPLQEVQIKTASTEPIPGPSSAPTWVSQMLPAPPSIETAQLRLEMAGAQPFPFPTNPPDISSWGSFTPNGASDGYHWPPGPYPPSQFPPTAYMQPSPHHPHPHPPPPPHCNPQPYPNSVHGNTYRNHPPPNNGSTRFVNNSPNNYQQRHRQ